MEKTRQRIPITDIERQRLRTHDKEHPSLTQEGLLSWFEQEFGRKISGSSVSDILSSKYSYLDSGEARGGGRKKGSQWPELEDALFQYWQDAQPRILTGPKLKMKAAKLWQAMNSGQDKKIPSFSDGWLTKWRTRYGIGQHSNVKTPWSGLDARTNREPFETGKFMERPSKRRRLSCQLSTNTSAGVFGDCINYGASRSRTLEISSFHSAYGTNDNGLTELHTGIEDLSLLCSLKQHGSIVKSNQNIFNSLAVLLNSAAKNPFPKPCPCHVAALCTQLGKVNTDISRAFNILRESEFFQLHLPELDFSEASCDQWFIDFINPGHIRSPSPEPLEVEDLCLRRYKNATRGERISQGMRQSRSFAAVTLHLRGRYRVDLLSQSHRITQNSSGDIVSEEFRAQIVVTSLVDNEHPRQVRFQLSTHSHQQMSPLSAPKISFRNVRPRGSRIFEIATNGNAVALEMAFFNSEGSVNDCDPEGRSLINYALISRNISIVKYLLPKIEDVDAYEADEFGNLRPLLALTCLHLPDILNNLKRRQEHGACIRLMLGAGADPSIPVGNSNNSVSVFMCNLGWHSLDTMTIYLDEGEPFLDVNMGSMQDEIPPLIYLSKRIFVIYFRLTLVHEKINLLLRRGADVNVKWHGNTCLHCVFLSQTMYNDHRVFKDILMSMVTAGADISACNSDQCTVSEIACQNSHEEIWLETLAECGYDVEPVLVCLKNYENYQKYLGMGCFPVRLPQVRPTKLCFKEYCQQRKSLDCVKYSYRFFPSWIKTSSFLKLIAEESDSEDYEWVSSSREFVNDGERELRSKDKDEDRISHDEGFDMYSWENKTIEDIKNEYYGGLDYQFKWWNIAKRRLWSVMDG